MSARSAWEQSGATHVACGKYPIPRASARGADIRHRPRVQNMPTLKRLLISAGCFGLLGLGVFLVLANIPVPAQREITVDIPQERLAAASQRARGVGSLQREAPKQLADTLETVKLGQ